MFNTKYENICKDRSFIKKMVEDYYRQIILKDDNLPYQFEGIRIVWYQGIAVKLNTKEMGVQELFINFDHLKKNELMRFGIRGDPIKIFGYIFGYKINGDALVLKLNNKQIDAFNDKTTTDENRALMLILEIREMFQSKIPCMIMSNLDIKKNKQENWKHIHNTSEYYETRKYKIIKKKNINFGKREIENSNYSKMGQFGEDCEINKFMNEKRQSGDILNEPLNIEKDKVPENWGNYDNRQLHEIDIDKQLELTREQKNNNMFNGKPANAPVNVL